MNAAKRALQEEAKRRQQELDETLRAEAEVREKEEALRKLREPVKKKRAPAEQPAPEPPPDPAAADARRRRFGAGCRTCRSCRPPGGSCHPGSGAAFATSRREAWGPRRWSRARRAA